MNEKLKEYSAAMREYSKTIIEFNRHGDDDTDFCPFHYCKPKEDGVYLTIRCGLSGIYTVLNEWKNGEWQMESLDGSTTIAYRKDQAIIDKLNSIMGGIK